MDLEFIAVVRPHRQRWLEAVKCTVNEPSIQVVPRPGRSGSIFAPVMRLTVLTTANHLPCRSLRVGIVMLSAQWRWRSRLRTAGTDAGGGTGRAKRRRSSLCSRCRSQPDEATLPSRTRPHGLGSLRRTISGSLTAFIHPSVSKCHQAFAAALQ